jgi:hypothetical protein
MDSAGIRLIQRAFIKESGAEIFSKPRSLMTTNRMNQMSAGSISLDNTFKLYFGCPAFPASVFSLLCSALGICCFLF